jgi:hypothetical protein
MQPFCVAAFLFFTMAISVKNAAVLCGGLFVFYDGDKCL